MGKKIVILNGSPRRAGNTAALAAEFTRGAEEAGKFGCGIFFWTAWISMAARDVSADTAAGNAHVSKRMTWTKYTRQ